MEKAYWCRKNPKSLLVSKIFRSYLADDVINLIEECFKDMAMIPTGLIPLVQGLVVCIMKPRKRNLKIQWNSWVVEGETLKKGENALWPS